MAETLLTTSPVRVGTRDMPELVDSIAFTSAGRLVVALVDTISLFGLTTMRLEAMGRPPRRIPVTASTTAAATDRAGAGHRRLRAGAAGCRVQRAGRGAMPYLAALQPLRTWPQA